ncbi:MAG: PQQ-binding-like beta-propeller repeat protein [Vicinamibacteraceae bacterium]
MNQRFGMSLAAVVLAAIATPSAEQWTGWRGTARTAVSTAAMPATLAAKASDVWAVPVGIGHASPLVDGERVYVFTRKGEQEVAQALDLATGKALWTAAYDQPYTMNSAATSHGKGPKSTPVLAGGRLFTLGITGVLSAFDAATGKAIWRHAFDKEFGAPPDFGTAMSPLVDSGLLIAHVGGIKGGALRAFDPATGATKWSWAGDGPGYASPVAIVAGGVRHIVTETQTKIVGVDAATGALLWSLPLVTPYEQNAVTPAVAGDLVILSGLDQSTFAVRPTRGADGKWTAVKVWDAKAFPMYMNSPVVVGDTVYGLTSRNKGQFFALDTKTGTTRWTSAPRQTESASITAAGGRLWCLTTEGALIVLKADPAAFASVGKLEVAPSATWASPVLLGPRMLVKDVEHLRLVKIG